MPNNSPKKTNPTHYIAELSDVTHLEKQYAGVHHQGGLPAQADIDDAQCIHKNLPLIIEAANRLIRRNFEVSITLKEIEAEEVDDSPSENYYEGNSVIQKHTKTTYEL